MYKRQIIISILTIFIILLSVGCSNKQENIPESNENDNADYDSLFQELEEKDVYERQLPINAPMMTLNAAIPSVAVVSIPLGIRISRILCIPNGNPAINIHQNQSEMCIRDSCSRVRFP